MTATDAPLVFEEIFRSVEESGSRDTRVLVVRAHPGVSLAFALGAARGLEAARLETVGAILFRGFDVPDVGAFKDFVAGFGRPLLPYDFASTPRHAVKEGVYSSTEYPAHQVIPQHNEQSYTRSWPLRIWFHCDLPARDGGETPITDSRAIFRRLDPAIRERFARDGLLYVRTYDEGLDLPWRRVFGTENRADVDAFCRDHGIDRDWLPGDRLRTRQLCQATARHPRTGEMVWFNQAHLFHVSALVPDVREALLAIVEEEDLPRNVLYGDGSPIEDGVLEEIRGLYAECSHAFPWQAGDILLLDNMLTAHGRNAFTGERRVRVAMTDPHRS